MKPELEYFCGVLWRVFCGACHRVVCTAGNRMTAADIAKQVSECPHCGCRIDWGEEGEQE